MTIRLIASDLDGTLLAPDHQLSERTITAIASARAEGIDVVPVTGRGHRTAIELIRHAAIDLAICSNGALVYDLRADRVTDTRPIDGPMARQVVESIRSNMPEASFGWETTSAVSFEPEFHTDHRSGQAAEETIDGIDGAIKLFVRHPTIVESDLQHTVAPLLPPGMAVSTSGAPFVEVTAEGVDKGTALAALATARGLTSNQVIAFGDQMNDLSMLEWAGTGVAMGNARSEAREIADRVALTNAEDGVALVIEEILVS